MAISYSKARVAIVHHWFVSVSGGERVVDAIVQLYPDADIFTLFCDPSGLPSRVSASKVTASFLNRIPGARRFHRHLLPLYPLAVESLDLRGYDLVISSDSGPVKGVITDPGAVHICYCHSPMRYLWDARLDYAKSMSTVARCGFQLSSHYVRNWDQGAAQRVDNFVANSAHVARRIRKYYRRDSTVIYPPIETSRGILADQVEDYYLAVGRLVSYKRTDLLIDACRKLGRTLVVVGAGPELKRLQRRADSNVHFVGPVHDDELWRLYSRCRALLFAAEEDFGIVPLEAQACGRPVIAYGRGGALETVLGLGSGNAPHSKPEFASPTGIFFDEQTADSLAEAIKSYEARQSEFDPREIQQHARRFDTSIFLNSFWSFVQATLHSPTTTSDPSELATRLEALRCDSTKVSTF